MSNTKAEPREESGLDLIRRAIAAFDHEIASLQAKRAQLIALAEPASTAVLVPTQTPVKQRTMSAEARAKISAAAKKRWAATKKAQASAASSTTTKKPAGKK